MEIFKIPLIRPQHFFHPLPIASSLTLSPLEGAVSAVVGRKRCAHPTYENRHLFGSGSSGLGKQKSKTYRWVINFTSG
jgi:hypothetical protein